MVEVVNGWMVIMITIIVVVVVVPVIMKKKTMTLMTRSEGKDEKIFVYVFALRSASNLFWNGASLIFAMKGIFMLYYTFLLCEQMWQSSQPMTQTPWVTGLLTLRMLWQKQKLTWRPPHHDVPSIFRIMRPLVQHTDLSSKYEKKKSIFIFGTDKKRIYTFYF